MKKDKCYRCNKEGNQTVIGSESGQHNGVKLTAFVYDCGWCKRRYLDCYPYHPKVFGELKIYGHKEVCKDCQMPIILRCYC